MLSKLVGENLALHISVYFLSQLTDSGGLNNTYSCLISLEDVNNGIITFTHPEDFSEPIFVERVSFSFRKLR